jgi:hypothetical protein
LSLTMSPRTAQLLLDGFKALAWPTAEVHQASRLLTQLERIASRAPRPTAAPGAPPGA